MSDRQSRVTELYGILHSMPEVGHEEIKTAAFLAEQLKKAGYEVHTGVGGTGVVGVIRGAGPGPVLALRADMDALQHIVDSQSCAIHSCGHDAHMAMVLCVAEQAAKKGITSGALKIIFQPAEEKLSGALSIIDAGALDDVDAILGIHLRPSQEAKRGQATPALYHGSSYIMEAEIEGVAAHGARPHLGVNAIDAAAAVVNAINAIHLNPVIPTSIKVTRLHADAGALNAIPAKAELAIDLRSQDNGLMEEMITKARRAVENAAASVGAKAIAKVKGGVPGAEYSEEMIELAREAIVHVLGKEGLLPPITTPGGEDFHFFIKQKPTVKAGYIGLGCDLTPGLHHPEMKFDINALIDGVNILLYMVAKQVGLKA
jgi:amidohydrolase